MSKLIVIGGGGHGAVVADSAAAQRPGRQIVFCDHDFPERSVVAERWPIVGRELRDVLRSEDEVVVGVGNNQVRGALLDEARSLGARIATVVHPSAVVSSGAALGEGTVVMANAVVNIASTLGAGCIVNTGATVDHDCLLGELNHVCPGAHLAGGVHSGAQCWFGIGSSVIQNVSVCEGALVAAGAVVVGDVTSPRVRGVPARPF